MSTPMPHYQPPAGPLVPLDLDASRERAVKLLSDGYAYDRLSESEFEWRLGRLNTTTSAAAVDALVSDLLAPAAWVPDGDAGGERRILAVMSESRHAGAWTVPSRLKVVGVMSEVRIDLRDATLPPECTIDISAVMANVHVIVPPGLPVQFDMGSMMASARSDAPPMGRTSADVPRIVVRGFALMSEVRVKVRPAG